MPEPQTGQQTRKPTPEEDIRVLYKRVARLNDRVAALLDPAWGAKARILPEDHPLHPGDTAERGAPVDWQAIAAQRERELKTEGEARHKAEEERDGAYRERAQLLAWLAAEAPAVIAPALDLDEPGWWIVYVNTTAGQLSWHISPRDAGLFTHVERVEPDDPRARWDGHTTAEKYDRIRALATGQSAEPDTCATVEVDGEQIRVHGRHPMSPESQAALAEVVGAAKRRHSAEHPEAVGQLTELRSSIRDWARRDNAEQPFRWRTVDTDAENEDGVALVCTAEGTDDQHAVIEHTGQRDQTGVYDCCPGPVVWCGSEPLAQYLVAVLNADADRP